MDSLYSIGHGNKSIEDFIEELSSLDIEYLIDVRSSPYSRWNPQFNQASLQKFLSKQGIVYVYMGDTLGGIPHNSSCYTDGKIDYRKMSQQPSFITGLERLIVANQKNIKLAIMCSESDPDICHRSKLIGEELRKRDIILQHIIGKAKLLSQIEVINMLTKGMGVVNLFGEEESFMSRKTYL